MLHVFSTNRLKLLACKPTATDNLGQRERSSCKHPLLETRVHVSAFEVDWDSTDPPSNPEDIWAEKTPRNETDPLSPDSTDFILLFSITYTRRCIYVYTLYAYGPMSIFKMA